jgi:hypothetical protein
LDGKTLSAFQVNFLSTLLRRGTVLDISFSIPKIYGRFKVTTDYFRIVRFYHPELFPSPCRRGARGEVYRGREKQILAPESGFGSAQMRPPCASTIARARYSPNPAPFVCLTAFVER